MNHAEIIAAAAVEARRQGFELVAIHAVPARQCAVTLCLCPGHHPWAVHVFGEINGGLNVGGYHATREGALAEFGERLGGVLFALAAA